MDPVRHLLRIDHITDAAVVGILDEARRLRQGAPPSARARPVIGLLFLSPSLRTRIGFAAAAARLGGIALDVSEARSTTQMSAPESFDDTLRTLSGMVDLVVVRTPFDLDIGRALAVARAPLVNGGDGQGEAVEPIVLSAKDTGEQQRSGEPCCCAGCLEDGQAREPAEQGSAQAAGRAEEGGGAGGQWLRHAVRVGSPASV